MVARLGREWPVLREVLPVTDRAGPTGIRNCPGCRARHRLGPGGFTDIARGRTGGAGIAWNEEVVDLPSFAARCELSLPACTVLGCEVRELSLYWAPW